MHVYRETCRRFKYIKWQVQTLLCWGHCENWARDLGKGEASAGPPFHADVWTRWISSLCGTDQGKQEKISIPPFAQLLLSCFLPASPSPPSFPPFQSLLTSCLCKRITPYPVLQWLTCHSCQLWCHLACSYSVSLMVVYTHTHTHTLTMNEAWASKVQLAFISLLCLWDLAHHWLWHTGP